MSSAPPPMRIAELSRRAEVPVATIKYYLREGLLPRGEHTAPNQARYGVGHVGRLRLIRALLDVGGLSISSVRDILEALDDEDRSVNDVLAVAHRALAPDPGAVSRAAIEEIDAFVDTLGWNVNPAAPDRAVLAQALSALRQSGWEVGPEVFTGYARAANEIAEREIEVVADLDREGLIKDAVIGSVVFGSVLSSLRRMAQEHHSKKDLSGR